MKNAMIIGLLVIVSFVNGYSELCSDCDYILKTDVMCDGDECTSVDDQSTVTTSVTEIETETVLETKTETTIVTTTTSATIESICSGEENGVLLPDPESCERFFLCLFETAVPSLCPDSQYFDREKSICDDRTNVICDDGHTTTEQPDICDNIPNGVLLFNPTSCSHFFICVENLAFPGECPLGLYFNKETQGCGADRGECIEPTTTTTEEITSTTEEPFNDVCVGQNNGVLVESSVSCAAFYLCLEDLAFPGTCPNSTLFNPVIGICDFAQNVYCPGYETTTEQINVCYGEPDFTFLNDEGTCEGYFLCFNGQPSPRTCPSGMYFDPSILICAPSDQVKCGDEVIVTTTEATTTEDTTTQKITTEETTTYELTSTEANIPESCPPSGTIAIPDESRCSRFSLCASGSIIPFACPTDQHFNFDHQGCLPRHIANCTIPMPICDSDTPSSVPISLVNPQYCNNFFVCFNGLMHMFECSEGLHFEPESEQCLDRSVVGCEV